MKNLKRNGLVKNLTIFDRNTRKYQVFELKEGTEELSFITQKSDAKFEEKLACGLKNDMKNLANFHQSTQKSWNWDFDGILSSKVEYVWAQKL